MADDRFASADQGCFTASVADRGSDLFGSIDAGIVMHANFGPLRGERLGQRRADARGCPGDEDDVAGQIGNYQFSHR
jgi:hypothetical protein